ncbi:MAG: SAF domain-containing protein [Carnobacterium alterfunditum]
MKKFGKVFLALLLIGLGVGFVFYFEFNLKDKLDTVEVVVAKDSIDFKQEIKASDLEVRNVRRASVVEGSVTPLQAESLVGKHASIVIKKGTQLYSELIDTYDLVPNEKKGEFVAPIPEEWLFAVPGSLRRTYVADVYAIGTKEQETIRALLIDAEKADGDKSKTKETEEEVPNVAPESLPILQDVRVASVKDGSNKEVVLSDETKDATGSVAALEIIANDEMLETLTKYTKEGYKLYVVYKFDRSDSNE